jgi:hypothetical protein
VRKRALLSLSLPLAAAGCLAGHALGYAVVPTGPRDARIHSYLTLAPQFLAVCVALVALTLGLRLSGRLQGRPAAWPFAILPPLAFCAQELVERLVAGLPAHAVLEPAVFAGLAAQLPVAVVAYLVARALLRVADTTVRAVSAVGATVVRPVPCPMPVPATGRVPTRTSPAFDRLGRAPPRR